MSVYNRELETLFDSYLKHYDYYVTATGQVRDRKEQAIPEAQFRSFLNVTQLMEFNQLKYDVITSDDFSAEAAAKAKKMKLPKLDSGTVSSLLFLGLRNKMEERLEFLREKVKSTGHNLAPMGEFVAILTGRPPLERDIYALAHSIWMIKRGLFKLKRVDHHMVNFVGAQGIGKSTAINRLFEPLSELMRTTALNKMTDSSSVQSCSTYLIQVCEELAGAQKQDIEHLKDLLTNEKPSDRMRYDTLISELDNRATFFGSSNKHISEIFYDPTGMRRWYEFQVSPELKSRWGELNNFDILSLWQGIDENLETGYMQGKYAKIGKEILAYKERSKKEEYKESFIHDMNIRYSKGMVSRLVPYSVMQDAFKNYLIDNGMENSHYFRSNVRAFDGLLINMGFEKGRSKNTRGWLLNDDCYIGQSEDEENKIRRVK